jgi:uncharacterized membrane protein YvlD (DUF360 family)
MVAPLAYSSKRPRHRGWLIAAIAIAVTGGVFVCGWIAMLILAVSLPENVRLTVAAGAFTLPIVAVVISLIAVLLAHGADRIFAWMALLGSLAMVLTIVILVGWGSQGVR